MNFFTKWTQFGQMTEENTEEKPRAALFVDYDYWESSYRTVHELEPDISSWFSSFQREYQIEDAFLFVDWKKSPMECSVADFTIVDTSDRLSKRGRSITDVLMTQQIYEYLIEHPDIDTYVLFIGRWYIDTTIQFLQKQGKTVILCGVRGAFPSLLLNVASKTYQYPFVSQDRLEKTIRTIITEIQNSESTYPTFSNVTVRVAKYLKVGESLVRRKVQSMIEDGQLVQQKEIMESQAEIRTLRLAKTE